ncbi:hypothetical protein T07_7964 [Trichinella nelsoni]|uniref:Uncharacterized protein n=1 Tax=Trichinella nelsoni TaxID=6336 RepID=A0A0V0RCI4_9BILA|nr:hypothetical protein T07_7964 [Trichinella nelsoni]
MGAFFTYYLFVMEDFLTYFLFVVILGSCGGFDLDFIFKHIGFMVDF